MRIFDADTDKTLKDVTLYLKYEEAKELYDSIGSLLEKKSFDEHEHINDATYEREITVLLYDEQHVESLNERSKKIIHPE